MLTKLIYNKLVFSYLERCMEYFFQKIWYILAANSHRFLVESIHKYHKSTKRCRCSMIGRNITNHSLEKKEAPCFDSFGTKTIFSSVFALEMHNFVLKVKPKKICKLQKWRHKNFCPKIIGQTTVHNLLEKINSIIPEALMK